MTREQLLAMLSETRDAALVHYDLPPEDRYKTYAPGKWCVRQILAHLADIEVVFLWRISLGLAQPDTAVLGIDPDAWAEGLDYMERPILINKELFHSARSQILFYIENSPEERLEQRVHHSERGWQTVWQLLETLATHTRHHLDQIDTARQGQVGGA